MRLPHLPPWFPSGTRLKACRLACRLWGGVLRMKQWGGLRASSPRPSDTAARRWRLPEPKGAQVKFIHHRQVFIAWLETKRRVAQKLRLPLKLSDEAGNTLRA